MKKLLPVTLMVFLLLTFMFGTSRPASAVTLRTATVNVAVLNVRSGPGTAHQRIATLNRGAVLPVLLERAGWAQISLQSGQTGWITTEFVTLRSQQPSSWARVNVASLNVRSGPDTTFNRIAGITLGTVLPVIHSQGNWHQLRLSSGQAGWVFSAHVTVSAANPTNIAPSPAVPPSPTPAPSPSPTLNQRNGTVNHFALPLRSGPDVTFNAVTTLPPQTQVTILQTQGRWHQVRLTTGQIGWVFAQYILINEASPTPLPAPSPIPQPAPLPAPVPAPIANTQNGTVTMAALPLRSGPDVSFQAITTLGLNSQLAILRTQGNWHEVRLPDGQVGWVFAQHISINQPAPLPSPISNQPETGQPEDGQTPTQRLARVTVNALNLRSSPSTEAERIALLPLGTLAEVVTESGEWLQIRLSSGQTGWVFAEFVLVFNRQTSPPAAGVGQSLAGQVIVIDPGHGGSPGAVGPTGLMEKEVVLDVSLRVAEMLRQAGATVILTRDNDSIVSLPQRVNIAAAANAHIFVSIHTNAHTNTAVGGTETYFFQNNATATASRLLAEYLQKELVQALGLRDIGVKHGNFHVIRETTMPSVLLELAFISNAQEEALMRTNDFRQNSANAIFRGIAAYFTF
ncbi:MAG: SH3 domain-containing protein [Dethiobacter sp.]|nr:SH3 domain-containing protein [Dethiobacter sp.]MBS3900785.1 SH3 domain-containing protein [Dethiobacter sp.]